MTDPKAALLADLEPVIAARQAANDAQQALKEKWIGSEVRLTGPAFEAARLRGRRAVINDLWVYVHLSDGKPRVTVQVRIRSIRRPGEFLTTPEWARVDEIEFETKPNP